MITQQFRKDTKAPEVVIRATGLSTKLSLNMYIVILVHRVINHQVAAAIIELWTLPAKNVRVARYQARVINANGFRARLQVHPAHLVLQALRPARLAVEDLEGIMIHVLPDIILDNAEQAQ